MIDDENDMIDYKNDMINDDDNGGGDKLNRLLKS